MWKQARRGVAQSCLEEQDGRAAILEQSGAARLCSTTRCDRANVLASCTVFVEGNFVEGFDGGLCLAVLWGFFEE